MAWANVQTLDRPVRREQAAWLDDQASAAFGSSSNEGRAGGPDLRQDDSRRRHQCWRRDGLSRLWNQQVGVGGQIFTGSNRVISWLRQSEALRRAG
jgi:hypothetical protein